MTSLHLSYKWLSFSKPRGPPQSVPEGLERHWVDTPGGKLEMLCAFPQQSLQTSTDNASSSRRQPPILFCHGGMGSAWVWTEYMRYLAARGVACYAISLRGHGDSWHPSYLRMVFGTTRRMLGDDLAAGIAWAQSRQGSPVVLVGHSSGGGLSQGVLSEGRVDVKALALLGAVPAYGFMGVYINWWKLDPWFTLRLVFHAWHPNSPLSHPVLTRQAFFGDAFPLSAVVAFQRRTNRYESYLWPFSMMRPFATADSVLRHVDGGSKKNARVLVMAGSQDKLMTSDVTHETVAFYQRAAMAEGAGADAVRIEVVEGAGHHLQNDVQWEDGAAKLLKFYLEVVSD